LAYIDNCLVNRRRIESLGSWEGHWEKTLVMLQHRWHRAGSLGVCHWWKQRLLGPTAMGSKHLEMHNDSDEESDCN
jgi:hypothetical protein